MYLQYLVFITKQADRKKLHENSVTIMLLCLTTMVNQDRTHYIVGIQCTDVTE